MFFYPLEVIYRHKCRFIAWSLTALCLLYLTSSFSCEELYAQSPETSRDSLSVRCLQAFTVSARHPKELSILRPQILSSLELKRLNAHSLADALRYFSGVQVKDYGGVGGLKTVNIRSMGSQHVGIYYDGIALGNAQNGQIDLGQYDLDNLEQIKVFNGQKSAMLQSARDFGHSGTVYLRSKRPHFLENKNYHLALALKIGSFGLLNPKLHFDYRMSPTISSRFSGELTTAHGRYPFRYRKYDAVGKKLLYDKEAIRENGDIFAFRLEESLYGKHDFGSWHAKFYHYQSKRGIPGAIVNNVWKRGERLWDRNSFVQGQFDFAPFKRFNSVFKMKYANYWTRFLRDDKRELYLDNQFRQQEAYLSCSNGYRWRDSWYVNLAYDYLYNQLRSNMSTSLSPNRSSHFLAVSSTYRKAWARVQASLLATFVRDSFAQSKTVFYRQAFSPALLGSFKLYRGLDLNTFVKHSFRMPTFNDLYYADLGNSLLKPEYTTQYNLGVVWQTSFPAYSIKSYTLGLEIYHNRVKNKIVAYPKGQQFRWTMLNLGQVVINGLEVRSSFDLQPLKSLTLSLKGLYTFQHAVDRTSPKDSFYKHQIPYVPKHSASLIVSALYHSCSLNYSFIYAGKRYNAQENIDYNLVQPWYTSDLSLSYLFRLWSMDCTLLLACNNLFAQDYEVIANYPMPKRNYHLSISLTL